MMRNLNPEWIGMMAFALASCLSSCSPGQEYPVRLRRPACKGFEFDLDSRLQITQTERVYRNQRLHREEKRALRLNLKALGRFTEDSADDRSAARTLRIMEFSAQSGDTTQELLPPESVVDAVLEGGRWSFAAGGKKLDSRLEQNLQDLLSLEHQGIHPADIFGAETPKRLGEVWRIDGGRLRRTLEQIGFKFSPPDVEGSCRLNEIKTIDGIECLAIAGNFLLPSFIPPGADEARLRNAEMQVLYEADYPLNGSLMRLQESSLKKLSFHFLPVELEDGDRVEEVKIEERLKQSKLQARKAHSP